MEETGRARPGLAENRRVEEYAELDFLNAATGRYATWRSPPRGAAGSWLNEKSAVPNSIPTPPLLRTRCEHPGSRRVPARISSAPPPWSVRARAPHRGMLPVLGVLNSHRVRGDDLASSASACRVWIFRAG